EQDDGMFISVGVSESHDFILISIGNHEQTEFRTIRAAHPTEEPTLFHPREGTLRYTPTHWNGRWYILTNADDAVDFQVMSCAGGQTSKAHWRDELPYQAGRYITELGATKHYLIRLERSSALPQIVVRDAHGSEHAIDVSEEAYTLDLAGGYEWDTAIQ